MDEKNIKTIKLPTIEIAKALKEKLVTQTETESQVIVPINFSTGRYGKLIRVWNNTFLQCKDLKNKRMLLFSDNIAIYPKGLEVAPCSTLNFTLIFENLPKACRSFDLIEDIPEKGGFLFKDIPRNDSNVYYQELR